MIYRRAKGGVLIFLFRIQEIESWSYRLAQLLSPCRGEDLSLPIRKSTPITVYAERTISHQFNEELAEGVSPTAIGFESEGKQQYICVDIK